MVLQTQVTHPQIRAEHPVRRRQIVRSARFLGKHRTNPDLEVVCTPYYTQPEAIRELTQRLLAKALLIPRPQVTVNPSRSWWPED